MKIRLMGSADLVQAWRAALEREYGITGAVYPSRRGDDGVRVYFDIDDRRAAEVVGLDAASSTTAKATARDVTTPAPAGARRARLPRS